MQCAEGGHCCQPGRGPKPQLSLSQKLSKLSANAAAMRSCKCRSFKRRILQQHLKSYHSEKKKTRLAVKFHLLLHLCPLEVQRYKKRPLSHFEYYGPFGTCSLTQFPGGKGLGVAQSGKLQAGCGEPRQFSEAIGFSKTSLTRLSKANSKALAIPGSP